MVDWALKDKFLAQYGLRPFLWSQQRNTKRYVTGCQSTATGSARATETMQMKTHCVHFVLWPRPLWQEMVQTDVIKHAAVYCRWHKIGESNTVLFFSFFFLGGFCEGRIARGIQTGTLSVSFSFVFTFVLLLLHHSKLPLISLSLILAIRMILVCTRSPFGIKFSWHLKTLHFKQFQRLKVDRQKHFPAQGYSLKLLNTTNLTRHKALWDRQTETKTKRGSILPVILTISSSPYFINRVNPFNQSH